jgi:hypothetical protein
MLSLESSYNWDKEFPVVSLDFNWSGFNPLVSLDFVPVLIMCCSFRNLPVQFTFLQFLSLK